MTPLAYPPTEIQCADCCETVVTVPYETAHEVIETPAACPLCGPGTIGLAGDTDSHIRFYPEARS